MTIKHRLLLIRPRIKWKITFIRKIIFQWKKLLTLSELNQTRSFLVEKKLEYARKNTDESRKYEFAVEKQIEIIDLILKGKHVIPNR